MITPQILFERAIRVGTPRPRPTYAGFRVVAELARMGAVAAVGTAEITGVTKIIATPTAGLRGYVIDVDAGRIVRSFVSGPGGAYTVGQLRGGRRYAVTAHDAPGGKDAAIEDYVYP